MARAFPVVCRAALSGPLIIGGGPAGAAAAITLARAGRDVTLIERSLQPADKVCGDFLSAEAIDAITFWGVALAALSPSPITTVSVAHGTRSATAPLPFAALGLSRRALDQALLGEAEASGAAILRGHAVRSVRRDGRVLRLDLGTRGQIDAETVFLATGKHDLRGVARDAQGTDLVGLKMYYALERGQRAALLDRVELYLFADGYAGLQPVEDDRAVLCILVAGARLRRVGGRWAGLLDSLTAESPRLADRLSGARVLLERPLAVAGLPYGYVHAPSPPDSPGLFRVGDQAAVIASFTGEGVALALASGSFAARTWLDHGNAALLYHRRHAAHIAPQMRLATQIHRLCLTRSMQRWLVGFGARFPTALRLAAAWTRSRAGVRQG